MGVSDSKYQKTFKQIKKVREGSKRFELQNFLKSTISQGKNIQYLKTSF